MLNYPHIKILSIPMDVSDDEENNKLLYRYKHITIQITGMYVKRHYEWYLLLVSNKKKRAVEVTVQLQRSAWQKGKTRYMSKSDHGCNPFEYPSKPRKLKKEEGKRKGAKIMSKAVVNEREKI